MEAKTDAELVELARRVDRTAYDELIRRHQRPIFALACILISDRFEAEDLTQEAFLRAWLNLDLLSDPAKFAPWLRRIIFGVCIDWLRTFRPDLYRLQNSETESVLLEAPTQAESVLMKLETVELRDRVWHAVAALPPRYRLPLTLFHLDGLSHAKVAGALGVSESGVRSLVTRARQKLAPMLASYAMEIMPALEDVLKEQRIRKSVMLHITDGESVAATLRHSGVPGDVKIYGDLMYEGPAPAGVTTEAWLETRANFLSQYGWLSFGEALRHLTAFEDALRSVSEHDEAILWLDHRPSDQLILIKLLDWFSRRPLGRVKLSLICVGFYPGMNYFVGLGQLRAQQLLSLADTRLRVSEAQLRIANLAWHAFTSPNPTAIESVIEGDTSALPFLAAALRRHLEQFPAVDNGLSRTECQALSVLREHGPLCARRLFFAVQALEDPLFMGDLSFLRILIDLASAQHPLIHPAEGNQLKLAPHAHTLETISPLKISEVGLRVLDGRADHVRLNGIDRWLGGVHLKGAEIKWRWNPEHRRLVHLEEA